MLLSSPTPSLGDLSVQLSIPDDCNGFDLQDILSADAFSGKNPDGNQVEAMSGKLVNTASVENEANLLGFNGSRNCQDHSDLGLEALLRSPDSSHSATNVANREDGRSVINIPLIVQKEDLTNGTSVKLPIQVGNDSSPKFVVQFNLPRCLDCKNEPSCECCKGGNCSGGSAKPERSVPDPHGQ